MKSKAEAKAELEKLQKKVESHEQQCSCLNCVEYANAEIAYTFDYEDYGSYL